MSMEIILLLVILWVSIANRIAIYRNHKKIEHILKDRKAN